LCVGNDSVSFYRNIEISLRFLLWTSTFKLNSQTLMLHDEDTLFKEFVMEFFFEVLFYVNKY